MARNRRWNGLGRVATVLVVVVVGLIVTRFETRGGAAVPPRAPVHVATTTRTNVIVILTDDQRWDQLWGMPQLQKLLVKHGVTFANSFVSDSLCCPSRASILTGNYAHTTTVYDNHPPNGGAYAFQRSGAQNSTIATWLKAGGYETGLFGKYLNAYRGGVPPGWDRWVSFETVGHRAETGAYPDAAAYSEYSVYTNAPGACRTQVRSCKLPHMVKTYSTTYFGNAATRFIDTAPASKPVFVYYAPYAPHSPSVPQQRYATRFPHLKPYRPPSFNEANVSDKPPWIRDLPRFDQVHVQQIDADRRGQFQTLLTVDNEVAAIVRALRQTHRLAHSVILFASDNGVSWGEHRQSAATKQLAYEEDLRVPLVVRYEPYTDRPRIDRHLVANIDWAPTLADIAGVAHPATAGRSFAPLIGKGRLATPWRTQFLLEHLDGNPPSLAPSFCGIRSTRYMYALYQGGYQELYDLKRDPYELRNVASKAAEAGVVARMRTLLARECRPPPPGYTGRGPRTYVHTIPRVLPFCVQAVNRLRRYHDLFYQHGYAACKGAPKG
jgi:arylsulfatase A-like enzyme